MQENSQETKEAQGKGCFTTAFSHSRVFPQVERFFHTASEDECGTLTTSSRLSATDVVPLPLKALYSPMHNKHWFS